ncbi:transporter, major facilitator family protein [Lactobacillus selangorensis]|uniref:Transporter, major facilitator family protein n=1 Tax=Lactobacillus selangorensis TaxID=81857 RepID=A0A0R2FXT1_9LACO|nr:MFS transporter [Lactobacillus selangorensis]KRN28678.1 transporter, major facilitator family protein [Lactobacillus selangorensis]KRN32912.1 transporter, major facilitator family protein [Lactobacillus selangorensis]
MSKRSILIVTCALLLSNAMGGLDSTIINTALPAIISDLHGIQLMGWIVAVFLLGTAVSTPLWSKLGEHVGNKHAYQFATSLFVLGAFLEGMSPNIYFLIVARTIMGIGDGGMISLPYIIYAKMYKDPHKRTQMLGFATASYSTATIIGPLVGGWIVDTFSWHWVFYLNVPLGLLSIILVQIFFKIPKSTKKGSPVDYLGATLMTAGLVCLLMAIEMIGTISTLYVILLLIVSAGLLGAMFIVEGRATDPIIPSRLFKNHPLMTDFILFALIWGAFVGFNIYIPMWAQGLLGTSAIIGGATQIPGSLTNFMGAESVAPLRMRFKPQSVVAMGIVAFIIAFAVMTIAGVQAPFWLLLVAGAFEGIGNGMCFNVLQIKVQQDAAQEDVPVATSFSFLIRMLSQTFMASILGIILNQALFKGVRNSHGRITLKMMNNLSDAASIHLLPKNLIPQMRVILHNGLHNIMLVSLLILVVAGLLNIWSYYKAQKVAA